MQHSRRQFLSLFPGLAMAYAIVPRLWQEVIAPVKVPLADKPKNPLPAAFSAATEQGKPLIVFLIPVSGEDWDFPAEGRALADLLGFGGEELWVALSLSEVVLAKTEHGAAWFRETQQPSGATPGDVDSKERKLPADAWALLCEPGENGAPRMHVLRAKLGPDWEDNEPEGRYAEGFDELAWRKRCQETLEKRIEARAEEVTGLLMGNAERLGLRAEWVRRSLTEDQLAGFEAWRTSGKTSLEPGTAPLAARAGALLLQAQPDSRPLRKLLAQSAKKRLWDRDMPGGAWYEDDFGCFPDPVFNEKLAVGIDCGTGGAPVSRRLLRYYRPE
ncbi:MAG: hypothetical protein R3F17_05870 [Planctomycetota bacterium]